MKLSLPLLLGGVALALLLAAAALVAWLIRSVPVAPLIAQPATAPTPEEVFREASRSVAMVYAAEPSGRIVGRGSGVFLERDLLVTSCHVIARGSTFVAVQRQQRARGRLAAYDEQRDLCALRVEGLDATPARVGAGASARVGQRVYAIGTPEGFEHTLSEGLVSGLRQSAAGPYIQITAPLSDGSSGGGLFDNEGRLIGITTFVYSSGQNLNFAAPAEWAADLAKKASAAGSVAQETRLPPQLTKQWRHPVLK